MSSCGTTRSSIWITNRQWLLGDMHSVQCRFLGYHITIFSNVWASYNYYIGHGIIGFQFAAHRLDKVCAELSFAQSADV